VSLRTGQSASIEAPDYWWYRARSHLLQQAVGPFLGSVDRLLDVGSADGPSVGWLDAADQISLDIDPRGLNPPHGVCASVMALPFADGAFDVVTAFDVIEHCAPEEDAVREVHRVLRPGGRFLMSVPAYQWAWTSFDVAAGHHRRYTRPRVVRALESAGFEVVRATHMFALTFPPFVVDRVARRVRDVPLEAAGKLPATPAAVDRFLLALCRAEGRLLTGRDLPFGSSIAVAAVRG
jgi:SAM-dependent methyltransferase